MLHSRRALRSISLSILLICGFLLSVAGETSVKVFDIIEISDLHGNLEDQAGRPVAAVLSSAVNSLRASNPSRTLMIAGGDLYQGPSPLSVLKGAPVRKFLNHVGLEATALGNHEFDWSLETFRDITMKDASYSVVCANLYDAQRKRPFRPYTVIVKDSVRIAVIGAITLETPSSILPAYAARYTFTDPVKEINAAAEEIRGSGAADIVIAVIHEGAEPDANGGSGTLITIARSLKKVDALFGGHSHTVINTMVNGMPVMVPSSYGKGFADLKITRAADGSLSFAGSYVALDNDGPEGYLSRSPKADPAVKAIVQDAKKEIGPVFAEVLGYTNRDLTRDQADSPFGESLLGNWGCDVIRRRTHADVAFQNNGGIRADLKKGAITFGAVYSLMPFDNTICTFLMSGRDLKALFDKALSSQDGKGLQLSGAKITYDLTRSQKGRIVSFILSDGSELSDDRIITVSTNNFIATGGDGFTALKKYIFRDTGILIREALAEDVKAHAGIEVKIEGRLVNAAKKKALIRNPAKGRSPFDFSSLRGSTLAR